MRFHARELRAAGQLQEARTWLEKAARTGDLPALLALADLSPADATPWLRLAAEQGDAVGMRRLGLALAEGAEESEGVSWLERADAAGDAVAPRELGLRQLHVPFHAPEPALALLRRASERGDGEAAFCLGCLYLTGWRVPLDVDQAGRWFLAARDLGHPLAEAQLPAELSAVAGAAPLWRGLLERAAQGGAGLASFLWARLLEDEAPERSRAALRRAADQGFLPALRLLGERLLEQAQERDPTAPEPSEDELGEVWLAKAAARGDVRAATQLGAYLVRQGERRGVQRLLHSARRGDPLAMRCLGMVYSFGHDGPADETKAMRWYARGAELGDVECKARLGWLLYQQGNKSRAEVLLREAAAGGDLNAASNLAVLLHERGRPGDLERAAELLRAAAEGGDEQGMRNYAKVLERGWGVPPDEAAAKRWYRRGAEADNLDALLDLAALCWRTKDTVEAIRWWERAAELGDEGAMASLGEAYLSRERGIYDLERSLSWWRKAALAGDADATSWLGHAYLRGKHVPRNPQAAVRLLRQAAARGDTDSLVTLGVAYENGALLPKDFDKAVGCYSQAAERKNARGMYNLALCYRDGIGVTRNLPRARAWLQRCIETTEDEAVRSLAEKKLRLLAR
ncbi:MAG TPA: hypothetical protein DEA08_14015 [Planctomycetes bacterium]|nr:hypothetical protein [Planctomycetota bacterium]